MKLPRDLKGSDLAKALCRDWGYRIVHQEGSYLILQTEIPSHQRISIPDHNPIRLGTLNDNRKSGQFRSPAQRHASSDGCG
jgi:hypothetical protein